MRITIGRKEYFNAAHRLYNPEWSEEQNLAFYGKCANPNYHGHNYTLIVKLAGEVDPKTGYLVDLKKVSTVIREEITDRFDHTNLNLDNDDFKGLIPSTENFAWVIWNRLRKKFDPKLELKIVLFETQNNFVEYNGE
ncbi:MAG: 6-carboxytetrahydropterin synthase [Bacteroidia bacterium]